MDKLKHSITLYGFGRSYIRGEASFEDILQKAKRMGGDAIEIVSPQMVPGHPNPSDKWVEYFRESCDKHGLVPLCYSIYVDSGKHRGRFLNETERLTGTINEMEFAKRLGCTVVRTQEPLMPYTMEKLLPYAEELGVHLAIELHGPASPSTPIFMQYEETFEKMNSDHLGVVIDFSAFASGAPGSVLNVFPDDVCNKPLLHKINHLYATTEMPEAELEQMILAEGGDGVDLLIARRKLFSIPHDVKMGTIYHRTKPDYEGFRRLLKWSKYMHGKFWYVDEDLNCPGIDYPEYVRIMKEEGYSGFIASEYEGGSFDETLDDEVQISRHIKMLDKLWAE